MTYPRKPALVPPKWRVVRNKYNSELQVVRWERPEQKTAKKIQFKSLKDGWRPPFPRPVVK